MMKRKELESLVTIGVIEGKFKKGKQRKKIDGLLAKYKRVTDVLKRCGIDICGRSPTLKNGPPNWLKLFHYKFAKNLLYNLTEF